MVSMGAQLKFFWLSLFILMPTSLLAQSQISSIVIKGLKRDTQIADLRRSLGFSEGDILDPKLIESAKKRLEGSSLFRSAHVSISDSKVLIDVKLKPVIRDVVITCADEHRPFLESRVATLKGERLSDIDIQKSIDDLYEACQGIGYFQAEITHSIEKIDDSESILRINIQENKQALVGTFEVRADTKRLESEVRDYMPIANNAPYRRDKILEAMKTWKAKQAAVGYLDAHIEIVSQSVSADTNRANIVLKVSRGPRYQVELSGGKSHFLVRGIKTEIIHLLSTHESAIPYAQRVQAHLLNLYRKNGFLNAKIDVSESLTVTVDEGPQHLLSQIDIHGVDTLAASDVANRIREIMKENFVSISDLDPPALFLDNFIVFDERSLIRARSQVQDELTQKGFLSAKLIGPQIHINPKNHFVTANFKLNLGSKTLIGSTEVVIPAGLQPAAAGLRPAATGIQTDLEACVTIKPKSPLMYKLLEGPRACMEEYLWNHGYPYAQVTADVDIPKDGLKANVQFEVRPGPLLKIERVEFRGLCATQLHTMTSRIDITKGSPFSVGQMASMRQTFLNTDIFDRVDVFTETSEASDDRRVLVIDVHERSRTSIELGVGASLEDGPRVSLLSTHRNLFGLGMSFKNRLQINYPAIFYGIPFLYPPKYLDALESRFKDDSPFIRALLYTEGRLSASLDYPLLFTSPWPADGIIDLSLSRELKIAYTLNRFAIESGVTVKPNSQFRVGPNVQYEFAQFYCPVGYKEGLGCGLGALDPATRRIDTGATHQATIKLSSSLDGRDSILRPKNGYFLDTSAEFGIGRADLGSINSYRAISYIKLLGNFNVFRPLSKSSTWHLSFRAGQIFELAQDDYVPLFKRFYLGGTNTIRGFAEDQILPADDPNWPATSFGPIDPNLPALSLGGNTFVLVRAEVRFPFSAEHDGAVFIDTGELLRSASNFSLSSVAVGAGFGIRYLTPIGPLMLDLGIRIIDGIRAYNSGFWQLFGLHFSIGYF